MVLHFDLGFIMCKYWLLILVMLEIPIGFAIVPTIDQHQLSDDITTTTDYAYNIGSYLNRLGTVMTAVDQIKQLHGLEQITAAGNAVCDLCTPIEQKQLETYIDTVNSDLCSQFGWAMTNITGLSKSFQSINDVILMFKTNPKAAGLALQQAAVQTQTATQNTLAQIQMLMAQQAQKQLAEQKLEKQNTNAVYTGFKNAGL